MDGRNKFRPAALACRLSNPYPEVILQVLLNAVTGEAELYDVWYRYSTCSMEGQEVDWKRLVEFTLQGNSNLEQYAILLVRAPIGLFFAISGGNKLFSAGGTKQVYDTLVKAKVPFPRQTAYFVGSVEFICGSLLALGFLSSPSCVALLIDMVVAVLTNTLSTVPKGLSSLNWLDDVLYLPAGLYVLFFIWLICSGPEKFSVDYWLAGKLLS